MEEKPNSNLGVYAIISSWSSLTRALVFVLVVLVLIYMIVIDILDKAKKNNMKLITGTGSVVEFGKDTTIVNFIVDPRGDSPRGWTKTGVTLSPGDKVRISATGSVNLAMGRMIETLLTEYRIKRENEASRGSRDVKDFTALQKQQSLFAYPWNGPTGIKLSDVTDLKAREHISKTKGNRVIPTADTGQLVAVISSGSSLPDLAKSEVIPFEQRDIAFDVKSGGHLWFIVNDEKYAGDDIADKIIWQDNLGFFSLLIRIDPSKKKDGDLL